MGFKFKQSDRNVQLAYRPMREPVVQGTSFNPSNCALTCSPEQILPLVSTYLRGRDYQSNCFSGRHSQEQHFAVKVINSVEKEQHQGAAGDEASERISIFKMSTALSTGCIHPLFHQVLENAEVPTSCIVVRAFTSLNQMEKELLQLRVMWELDAAITGHIHPSISHRHNSAILFNF